MGYASVGNFFYGFWIDENEIDRQNLPSNLSQLSASWDQVGIGLSSNGFTDESFYYLAIKSTHQTIFYTGNFEVRFTIPGVDTGLWEHKLFKACKVLNVKYHPSEFLFGFTERDYICFFFGMPIRNQKWVPPDQLPPNMTWDFRHSYEVRKPAFTIGKIRAEDKNFYLIINDSYNATGHNTSFSLPLAQKGSQRKLLPSPSRPSTKEWDELLREVCEKYALPWRPPTFHIRLYFY